MKKNNPVEFLMLHQKAVLAAYECHNRSPKKTWDSLEKSLPGLKEAMSKNTFTQYVSVFALMMSNQNQVMQEKADVIQELDKKEKEVAELAQTVDELKTRLSQKKTDDERKPKTERNTNHPPKRIEGWNVQRSKDGYYRCYRKIANRVHSVYIGKTMDLDKARQKVLEKENEVRLDKG